MRRQILRALLVTQFLLAASTAQARTTVAVVPFGTASGDEYHWIGSGLATALATRAALQPDINAVTLRQLNAALRQDNLDEARKNEPDVAQKLGKLVGADVLITASYEARWPDITVQLLVLDPKSNKTLNTQTIDGGLDNLIELEARLARAVAQALGATDPDVTPGTFGTDNLRAWRLVTLAEATLDWQSLGPVAADPKTPLALPEAAVKTARDQLMQATQLDPDYGEAWAALGITQALLSDTKSAWKSFGKATALGAGHHPTAVLGASFVRMREGRFNDALAILESAIARYPGFLHARGYLGELLNHIGRHKEALAAFEGYAAVAVGQPWVLAQRGYTKSRLGDHKGGIADTVAAVDLVPDAPSLLIQLASRYIDAGKLIGAEDALTQAMQIAPEQTRIYVRLGYVYLLQEKDELAIPISEKALVQAKLGGSSKDKAYAHLNLARAYGRKGDLNKALEHLLAAKDAGLSSLSEIESDPKLGNLRKDARYKKLAGTK